jgi:hypothetical protein
MTDAGSSPQKASPAAQSNDGDQRGGRDIAIKFPVREKASEEYIKRPDVRCR